MARERLPVVPWNIASGILSHGLVARSGPRVRLVCLSQPFAWTISLVFRQHPPQPESDLRSVIELAGTDPEVEHTVEQGDRLATPGRDLGRLGIRLQILDGERLVGVCRGVLRARRLPPGGPVKLPRAGQVCRGYGLHAFSMARRIGDG